MDFGIASAGDGPGRVGTPGFVAPEVAAGEPPSRASDVFSLAMTAFMLLTGSPPRGGAPEWPVRIVEVNPAREDFTQQEFHKIPPTFVLDATDDMKIMQDEIFGPLLPVKTYKKVEEAIDYINGKARPLGLYYFGTDKAEQERVLTRTTSGGVTVNDVIMHVAMEDLPFGGVGPSGMGAYHGPEGFKTLSHAKGVYTQAKVNVAAGIRPPFG